MIPRQVKVGNCVEQKRRGSTVTDKIVQMSVLKGQLVDAVTPSETHRGYIKGLDDYHYVVVPQSDPRVSVVLSKSTTSLKVYEDHLMEHEPDGMRERIEQATAPFRDKLNRERNR